MKTNKFFSTAAVVIGMLGSTISLPAADEAAPPAKPNREEVRGQLKGLSPEERAAKVRELREKQNLQRRSLTPEERQARRKQMRERLDKSIADLRQKKTDGTITPQESKRLERLEEVAKRFDHNESPEDKRRPEVKDSAPAKSAPVKPAK